MRTLVLLLLISLGLAISLSSCEPEPPPPCEGTEEDPCVWVFVPSRDRESIQEGAEAIAGVIKRDAGIFIEPRVALDFLDAAEQMCRGEAHIGALNTFSYLVAHDVWNCAEIGFVTERFESTHYNGQIVANADSGIVTVRDLRGRTFCRPDPASTSGWIMPSLLMQAEGIDPETDIEIIESEGHTGVILDVYRGVCEAGASFGDARDDPEIKDAFPDVKERVVAIAQTSPIPNDTISFLPDWPERHRRSIMDAFLEVPPEIRRLPQDWDGIREADDSTYDLVRAEIIDSGSEVAGFIPAYPPEAELIEIPLSGPIASRSSEISSMAWYGDHLILMPQDPDFFSQEAPVFFALPEEDIVDVIDQLAASGMPEPLEPLQIPLPKADLDELRDKIVDFDGFEAIAFDGNNIYLTIEAEPPTGREGWLVSGMIAPDLSGIDLDTERIDWIEPQAGFGQWSDETIVSSGDGLFTLYEVNGQLGEARNPGPHATVFNLDLNHQGEIPFPHIEYRVTDATALDEENRFWVINYLFPPEQINPLTPDTQFTDRGCPWGRSHAALPQVERLVEFQYTPEGIMLIDDSCPIQIELLYRPEFYNVEEGPPADDPRNWEGLVRLDDRGFLIISDEHPLTIFGFIEYMDQEERVGN